MLSQPQGHSAAGRIMSMKNSNETIGNRTRDLPACSAVQPRVHRQILLVWLNEWQDVRNMWQGGMILKWVFKKHNKLCNRLQSIPDRVQRISSMNTVMNLWAPWMIKERFWLAEHLCSTALVITYHTNTFYCPALTATYVKSILSVKCLKYMYAKCVQWNLCVPCTLRIMLCALNYRWCRETDR